MVLGINGLALSNMKSLKQKGFTLIELLVTMSIMVILISVVLANFSGTRGRRNVGLAKDNMASYIRKMQSYSLSSKNINGAASVAYGVHFTSIGSSSASTSYDLVGYNNTDGARQVLQTAYLPSNTYIKSVSVTPPSNSATITSEWQGTFQNPYARFAQTYTGVSFSAINEENDITVITISTADNSYSSTITINGFTGVISE